MNLVLFWRNGAKEERIVTGCKRRESLGAILRPGLEQTADDMYIGTAAARPLVIFD